jgi:hypothetical protein
MFCGVELVHGCMAAQITTGGWTEELSFTWIKLYIEEMIQPLSDYATPFVMGAPSSPTPQSLTTPFQSAIRPSRMVTTTTRTCSPST